MAVDIIWPYLNRLEAESLAMPGSIDRGGCLFSAHAVLHCMDSHLA